LQIEQIAAAFDQAHARRLSFAQAFVDAGNDHDER
jgi:hypothetical protein